MQSAVNQEIMRTEYTVRKFKSGMHFIILDAETVSTLTKNENKRIMCQMNGRVEFHCAIMPKKEGGHFINIGSAICKKLQLKEGSLVTATFTVDDSEYQFEMPEVIKEVLNTDREASKIFHSLTEGNQRGLIYLVTQAKSTDKKIERALRIMEKIKSGITSPRVILK